MSYRNRFVTKYDQTILLNAGHASHTFSPWPRSYSLYSLTASFSTGPDVAARTLDLGVAISGVDIAYLCPGSAATIQADESGRILAAPGLVPTKGPDAAHLTFPLPQGGLYIPYSATLTLTFVNAVGTDQMTNFTLIFDDPDL